MLLCAGRRGGFRSSLVMRASVRPNAEQSEDAESALSVLQSWRRARLTEVSKELDWSRCFVSVLIVDAPQTPSYVRARLAQRLVDGAAEWNGLGRLVEVYSCASGAVDHGSREVFVDGDNLPRQAIAEFASNVGLEDAEVKTILRKLGAELWSGLVDEDLRQHDIVIALDSEALAAATAEFMQQGLEKEVGEKLRLWSDFAWLFETERAAIGAGCCADGSGTDFLDERTMAAVLQCEFERSFDDLANNDDFDVPRWPTRPLGLAIVDGNLGEWRRLHCSLVRGCWGLVWFLNEARQGQFHDRGHDN